MLYFGIITQCICAIIVFDKKYDFILFVESNKYVVFYSSCFRIFDVVGEYENGFRRYRLTIDHMFIIRQILEKKWEYNISAIYRF